GGLRPATKSGLAVRCRRTRWGWLKCAADEDVQSSGSRNGPERQSRSLPARLDVAALRERQGPPKHDQVQQQFIPNCYLAATLAAMANTANGRKRITNMITAQKGAITTICRKYDLQSVGAEERINSDRWFTVAFKGTNVDVSDVLYHDDSEHNAHLRYMTTPKSDR